MCCSFCPVTPCSWKTKPCYDLCGLVLYSSRAEDCLKTGNMFLGYLFFFCFVFYFLFHSDSESHPRALLQTLRSHLPGSTAGREWKLKSCFLVIHVELKMPADLCVVALNRHGHIDLSILLVSYPLTALTFLFNSFQCYLCFFLFLRRKNKDKRNTKEKKIIKDLEKKQHKNNSVSLYMLHTEQAHMLRQHTHTHTYTAVLTLTAPLEIRLIRFRKIIIKLMNRVGGNNTHCMAGFVANAHTCSWTHMHARTLFLELYVLLPNLFSQ